MISFLGSPVVLNVLLTETVMHARSPARAKRRAARGPRYRQHYITRGKREILRMPDGTFVMHPDVYDLMIATMKKLKPAAGR